MLTVRTMFVSTRSRYALRALLRIAHYYEERTPVSVRFISQKENITPDYLVQLFQQLKRSGIIRSIRGPKGGYQLTRSPEDIRVIDVFKTFSEDLLEDFCRINYYSCELKDRCIAQHFWKEVRSIIENFSTNMTLQDILDNYGGNNHDTQRKST